METNQTVIAFAANYPEFNPIANGTSANTTYVVSLDHQIDGEIVLAQNVTLIFAGGKIKKGKNVVVGGVSILPKLMGNNTFIVALIQEIFDINLEISGSWIMDRAYPQWFGARNTYRDTVSNKMEYDATTAINKAIALKRVGDVFIPRGEYLVAGTIVMKMGIILKGEKALTGYDPSAVPVVNIDQNLYEYGGTMLRSLRGGTVGANGTYPKGYMMLLNVNPNYPSSGSEWSLQWPENHTGVQDIYFMNDGVRNLKGIYAHGGFNIEYCRWRHFAQAVATTTHYTDNKTICFCHFYNGIAHDKETVGSTTDYRYAFEINLGDGFKFESVNISLNNKHMKGSLKLQLCNGGVISNCIFNDNVLIQNSKAILFAGNHLEGTKTQMTVLRSIVTISSNFFEKGCFPSLRIDGNESEEFVRSVVALDNNFIGYYGDDKTGFYTDGSGKLQPNRKPYGISNFDIMTNGQAVIKINNSFRYWVLREAINKVNPYGLRICKSKDQTLPDSPTQGHNPDVADNLVEVTDFNNLSHLHSIDSQIMPINSFSLNNLLLIPANLTIPWCGRFSYVNWRLATDATPTYRVQVILDKTRKIIGNNIVTPSIQNDAGNARRKESVMFTIGGIYESGFNCIIRLERTFKGNAMICDIPTCGAIHFYDNGEDVNGYKWIAGSLFATGYKPLHNIQFVGKNIVCKGTTNPTEGTWLDGDIIFNMGSGSNALWIRQNGSWVAK